MGASNTINGSSNLYSTLECDFQSINISNAIYDELYIEEISSNTSNIMPDDTFSTEWYDNTLLHASFENTTTAGGLNVGDGKTAGFIIKHRELGDLLWTTVATVPATDKKIKDNRLHAFATDITCRSKHTYEYMICPVQNGIILEESYVNKPITCETDGIVVVNNSSIYYTNLNATIDSITHNSASTSVVPYNTKYPYVFKNGICNYANGEAKGFFALRNDNDEYDFENSWAYIEKFHSFLNDGTAKILKYYDGRTWLIGVVDTNSEDFSQHHLMDDSTFNWVEIGDVSKTDDLIRCGIMEDI